MKRLWTNIIIFFGCFLLLVTTLGAVLVIAPGMELLGIMYIRSTSGSVSVSESVSDANRFNTITVESDNIPVVIEFVQSYSLTVDFVEKYDGFAKAGPEPFINIKSTGTGLVIESHEYKPFFGFSRVEDAGLYVKIPMYYTNDIVVNSNKSKVKFAGQKASVNDVTINANGDITLCNDMALKTLTLNMGKKNATVADNVNITGRVVANSTHGDLYLPAGFNGMVEYTSTTGDLICAGCRQLTFKSTTGKVKGTGTQNPIINGDAFINTGGNVTIESIGGAGVIYSKHGKVVLGKENSLYNNRIQIATKTGDVTMFGTYTNVENTITTKYGDIIVDCLKNTTIELNRGELKVKDFQDGKIVSTFGDIEIINLQNAVIETQRGDVSIGDDDHEKVSGSATITTKNGNVDIENAGDCIFVITTQKGDISFSQNVEGKADIQITSKSGDVELENITGKTIVKTEGKISAEVYNINETIELIGKNKGVDVSVRNQCYLDLSSKKKIITAPGMAERAKTFNNVPEGENRFIKVTTEKGKIAVYVD